MIFLIFLLWPVFEIYVMYQVGSEIGFWRTVGMLFMITILGSMIARLQGQAVWMKIQIDLARGQVPATPMVHSLLIWFGAFLLIVPGFLSDVIGVLLILPGTRHLAVGAAKAYLASRMARGSPFGVRVFTSGFPPPGFGRGPTAGPGYGDSQNRGPSGMRDVTPTVIDVAAERITDGSEKKPQ